MKLYRIASKAYQIFDGTGAKIHGGRWNSPGFSVIYASPNLSCARLEVMANHGRNVMPLNLAYIEIEVPDDLEIETLDLAMLPEDWDADSRFDIARRIGDSWILTQRTLLMRIPS